MKKMLFWTLLLLCTKTFAQNDSTLMLSIDKAIELGLAQRFEIQNQQLAIEISENSRGKVQSGNLPQVSASVDFRYNIALPTSLLPPAFSGGPNYTEVKFGTPYNNLTSVNVTQNLYNPNISGDKQITGTQVQYDELTLERVKRDIKIGIANAYYTVLLNQEQVNLLKDNLVTAEEVFRKGKAEFADGVLLKSDLDRYDLDVKNIRSQLVTAERNLVNSMIYLKTQLAVGLSTNVALTDSLDALILGVGNADIEEFNAEARHEYKMEETMLRINNMQYQKVGKTFLPTVYLYGNVSVQNQSVDFALFNTKFWYPYSFVGVHADVPIFDGMGKSRARAEYRLKAMQNENNLKRLRNDLYYESLAAKAQLESTYQQYLVSKENFQLAKSILETDKTRYQQGVITYAVFKNTEYSLLSAQNNYLNSIYEVLVAQLNYKKAAGIW